MTCFLKIRHGFVYLTKKRAYDKIFQVKAGKFSEMKLNETHFSLKETTILRVGNFETFCGLPILSI